MNYSYLKNQLKYIHKVFVLLFSYDTVKRGLKALDWQQPLCSLRSDWMSQLQNDIWEPA